MTPKRSPVPGLLWRARLRLAGLSLLVMGSLLYGAGWAMGRLLLQTKQGAIQRELETIAGTLHDSLRPSLPEYGPASLNIAAVLPGLCPVREPCRPPADLIHRHGISASDPDRFKLRVLDLHGGLIARSPGTMPLETAPGQTGWVLAGDRAAGRWGTYTIHLHHAQAPGEAIWGYLQVSRSLAELDAEADRLWWLGHAVFSLAMLVMALASWWLAGLAMAPLVEAYRRQEQFSADVAHELRTPLANLLALVEAERSTIAELPASRTATSLDRVLGQGRRLQQLIADLLLLANLERPFPQSQKQVCNLAEISADVLEECGEAAAVAQVSLEQKRWMSPARVLGNEAELGRLLINLVSNAIQHSPIGGRIEVSLEQRGREIKLSIHDSGPGIPAAQRQHIFDRFTRLDPARSRSQGGTGLGLAIAQAIARRHGGGISVQCNPVQSNPVQSSSGVGSCFCVTLPSAD